MENIGVDAPEKSGEKEGWEIESKKTGWKNSNLRRMEQRYRFLEEV